MKKRFYKNAVRNKNSIWLREIDESGKENYSKVKFQPSLYTRTQDNNTPFKTLDDFPLQERTFDSMGSANWYIKNNNAPDYLYGNTNFVSQFLMDIHPEEEIPYEDSKIKKLFFDIETTCGNGFPDIDAAEEAVISISAYDSFSKRLKIFLLDESCHEKYDIGGGQYDKEKHEDGEGVSYDPENVDIINCMDERELLLQFINYWKRDGYPDIITGWYINFFDIPYLVNRITKLFGWEYAKRLSPWESITAHEVPFFKKVLKKYNILGVETLDYIELYKKFVPAGRESYSLDYIAYFELGEQKLDYSEHGSLHLLYKNDYPKFIRYNIHDTHLVYKIDQSMKLIDLAVHMAYLAKVNYSDIFSSIKVIEGICYSYLLNRSIIMPLKSGGTKTKTIEGGYVKEPEKSKFDWVVSFDVNSLYPSIILQQNLSPETLIEDEYEPVSVEQLLHKRKDLSHLTNKTLCANGHLFSTKKQGFIPEIIGKLYKERKANKGLMQKYRKGGKDALAKIYDIKQHSQKILLNSFFGVLDNPYFVFYDCRISEAITKHGQLIIKWSEKYTNEYLNKILKSDNTDYVKAIDTDSIYLTLGDIVDQVCPDKTLEEKISFVDNVCEKKLEPVLEKAFEDLSEYTNSYQNSIVMKREIISSSALWTGKKRYAALVYDDEGLRLKDPKLKIMGLETAKSSTPEFCKDRLKSAIRICLDGSEDEMKRFIEETRKVFYGLKPEEISFPRSVNGVSDYYCPVNMFKSGCPIHVRGSIIYNKLLDDNDLGDRYHKISDGDKIKYCYLKKENPTRQHVIAFKDSLPKEFNMMDYLDYKINFHKSFIEPLESIANSCGWSTQKKKRSLFDL